MKRGAFALSCALVLAACDRGSSASGSNSAAPVVLAPSAAKTAPSNAVHLGEPISAEEVALADVARDPSSFVGHAFTTRGTVTAVCQEMGCWMEIKDGGTGAHLRMHGHAFFVPKTASGRHARVQATLVPPQAPNSCSEEAECAPKDVAMLQLDATGVELN
jgi:hypothetical protein